jgi:parallel beta-helix repeat protein
MRKRLSRVVPLVAASLLAVPAASAQAPAQPVQCGQVITQDVKLEADLSCSGAPEETALTIGAPGITLDLGGHEISTAREGVRNEGHDDVTIRNGTIVSESGSVLLSGVSGNVIRNVAVRGLVRGISLEDSDHNRIISNELSSAFLSLADGSDWNTVRDNQVTLYEGAIGVSDSAHNRIVDNVVWTEEDAPLSLLRAHRNTVHRNTLVSGFGFYAPLMHLVASNGNDIARNLGVTYGDFRAIGIRLEGSNRNVFARNDLRGTPLGVWIQSGNGNELRANTAEGAEPYEAFDPEPDGFHVAQAAQRTHLFGNTATGFADDGFSVFGALSALGSNSANDNGDYGIEAPGAIDLGGNRAAGNGNPQQCTGVVCG